MIFLLRSLYKADFALNSLPFIASVGSTHSPFQFIFALSLAAKIISFFCLLSLICLFIPIYFWRSLAKAGSSVQLCGLGCFVLLCKLSLRTLNLLRPFLWKVDRRYLQDFWSCRRGRLLLIFLSHYRRLLLLRICRLQ